MDVSDLINLLQWLGSIFPVFSIEFPFHIAYDIIIRLASSWILEDSAGELASMFSSAFGSSLSYMYEIDPAFMEMCRSTWNSTTGFALALLPLMLMLSIFSTVKYSSERSLLTLVKTRELAFGTILNVGLAASSYWVFIKVLSISTMLGKEMLAISGISIADGFSTAAGRIFLPAMLTEIDGSSEALLVVLMFLRLFLTLILFISIVLVSVSTRIGILLLFGISPVCFVLSVYEEFDWIRDSWIKAFLGFILTPVLDGILLALIMVNNEKFVNGMTMGEVFRTLCVSIGIACMIVMLHSEVIKRIFDALIADFKKAVRAVKTVAQVIARIFLVVSSGGASEAGAKAASPAEKAGKAAGAAETAKKTDRDSGEKQNKTPEHRPSPAEKNIKRMKKRIADRYQMKPEEIARAGSAIKDVLAAMDEISLHEYGENLNTAVRRGMRQPEAVRKYFDRNGGAAGIMAAGLMDRAGQNIFHSDSHDQPQPEVSGRKDNGDHTEDSLHHGFRCEMEERGVDQDYFPDRPVDNGQYEDTGADTFRNLNDVARRGMDTAMRGGTYNEIRNAMQDEFDRKRSFGFDMDFQNYRPESFVLINKEEL